MKKPPRPGARGSYPTWFHPSSTAVKTVALLAVTGLPAAPYSHQCMITGDLRSRLPGGFPAREVKRACSHGPLSLGPPRAVLVPVNAQGCEFGNCLSHTRRSTSWQVQDTLPVYHTSYESCSITWRRILSNPRRAVSPRRASQAVTKSTDIIACLYHLSIGLSTVLSTGVRPANAEQGVRVLHTWPAGATFT